jgi:hypothetical protein
VWVLAGSGQAINQDADAHAANDVGVIVLFSLLHIPLFFPSADAEQ